MKLEKSFRLLCAPARFYLGISVFFILVLLVQNLLNSNSSELCVGVYKCDFPHVAIFFISKILYVLFWTWLLNLFCRYGFKTLSWFLVLVPFLLFALGVAIVFYVALTHKKNKEMAETNTNKQ